MGFVYSSQSRSSRRACSVSISKSKLLQGRLKPIKPINIHMGTIWVILQALPTAIGWISGSREGNHWTFQWCLFLHISILCVVFLYKYRFPYSFIFSRFFYGFFSMKSVFFLGLFGMKESRKGEGEREEADLSWDRIELNINENNPQSQWSLLTSQFRCGRLY